MADKDISNSAHGRIIGNNAKILNTKPLSPEAMNACVRELQAFSMQLLSRSNDFAKWDSLDAISENHVRLARQALLPKNKGKWATIISTAGGIGLGYILPVMFAGSNPDRGGVSILILVASALALFGAWFSQFKK